MSNKQAVIALCLGFVVMAVACAKEVPAEIVAVSNHLHGNKLGIKQGDLRSISNPRGQGTFVFCPTKDFHGTERLILWLVLNGQPFPLNGATKGSVTPNLPWSREVPKEQWSTTGLDPYSPKEALKIVFGEK